MTRSPEFEALLAEGEAVAVESWDFSWFDGRATDERPSWGYAGLAAERIAAVDSVLDPQTGGAEVFAGALAAAASRTSGHLPGTVWTTEGWPPSLEPRALRVHDGAAAGGRERRARPGEPGGGHPGARAAGGG